MDIKLNKWLLSLCRTVLFTICLLFLQAASASKCGEHLAGVPMTLDQQFERVDSLVQMQADLLADTYSVRGLFQSKNDQKALAELDRIVLSLNETQLEIESLSEQLIEEIELEDAKIYKVSDELTSLSVEVKDIRYGNFKYEDTTFDTFRLSHLQRHPQDIVANTVYKAQSHNGDQEIKFLFSKKVVNELFLSTDSRHIEAIEKSLANIRKGVFAGSYDGVGIIRLSSWDRSFVEIRQRGKNTGSIRIYGYEFNGVFHFVHWRASNRHGDHQVKTAANAIKAIKENNSH